MNRNSADMFANAGNIYLTLHIITYDIMLYVVDDHPDMVNVARTEF